MYSVSEAYITKMLDEIQTHKLTGTIDGIAFSDSDVIGVNYSNRCADKKVQLGSVYIGVLKLTFLNDILNRGEYRGKKITLSDSLIVGHDENEDPIWESVPIGEFYIAEAVWTAAGVDVTAYDVLSKLDEQINIDETSSTIYGFCTFIASETDTTFGMTELECEALPNGDEIIAPYEDSNFETYRDLLSALAQMVGGFATAKRDGSWIIRPFEDTSVVSVPKNRRASGTSFSDYVTYYDTIQYTDAVAEMVRYIGDDEGLVMKLETQPFLQYGTERAKERRAQNIVDSIKRMRYTPFKASMLPAFVCLDLGDVITLSEDYSGGNSSGCVMSVTWTFNKSFSIQCYGDNPNLRNGQSKADKNIVGLINSTTQNEVTYYYYENLDRFEFGSDQEVTLATLYFTAAQQTTVKIMHEFIFDMIRELGVEGSYELRYYLDGELISYKPKEQLSAISGSVEIPTSVDPEDPEDPEPTETYDVTFEPVDFTITRDFFYVLRNVTPNQRHTWQVRILTHGIEQTSIEIQNAHVLLEGQRLFSEAAFDGYIDITETVTKILLAGLDVKALTESADIEFNNVAQIVGFDDLEKLDIGPLELRPLDYVMHVYIESLYLKRITEDGYQRITEDGFRRISE